MSEARCTKGNGKWEPRIVEYAIGNTGDYGICAGVYDDKGILVASIETDGRSETEVAANARLIAAAPTLLDALNASLNVIHCRAKCPCDHQYDEFRYQRHCKHVLQIAKALSKVKGDAK